MKIIQFGDESETTIVSVFAFQQDPAVYSFLGEVEDDDPRYVLFVDNFPFPIE